MAGPSTLHDWVETLPEDGRCVFSRADAAEAPRASDAAIKVTRYRLKQKGALRRRRPSTR